MWGLAAVKDSAKKVENNAEHNKMMIIHYGRPNESTFYFLLLSLFLKTSFWIAGNAEDEEQACCWDHHKKEKE